MIFGGLSPGHTIITDPAMLGPMVAEMRQQRTRALDFETDGVRWWVGNKPIGAALGYRKPDGTHRAWYIPVAHRTMDRQCPVGHAKAAFRDALQGADELVGHNLKFDLNHARADGWEIPEWVPLHDSIIQGYLLNENRRFALEALIDEYGISPFKDGAHGAKDLVEQFLKKRAKDYKLPLKRSKKGMDHCYLGRFGHAEVPVALEGEYACRDIAHTLCLDAFQRRAAMGIGTWYADRRQVLYANEMLLVRALADIEWTGQLIDADYLRQVSVDLDRYLESHGGALANSFGATIKWNNDTEVRDLLYGHLNLPVLRTTDKGQPSVDKSTLMALQNYHPGIVALSEWRQRFKVRSTYTDSLLQKLDQHGRLHTDLVQFGTATGRLSSRQPNLQNIPSRHPELSKIVRRAFIVPQGKSRILVDYSQIELRVLAWSTQCPTFMNAYESPAYMAYLKGEIDYEQYRWVRRREPKVDLHGDAARDSLGGRKVPEGDPAYALWYAKRAAAKIINFSVPYGGGPNVLMGDPQLRLPKNEAEAYFQAYHRKNPEINQTQQRLFAHMRANRCTFVNWAGRVRHGPRLLWTRRRGGNCPVAEEERSMFASLIQGSAGELTRFSLVRMWLLQKKGLMPGKTMGTVHDEIGVDCDKHEARECALISQREMEGFKGMFGTIPVIADIEKTETNWAEKAEYSPLTEAA